MRGENGGKLEGGKGEKCEREKAGNLRGKGQ